MVGFDLPPMIKQPYHPRYYQALVEGAPGMVKVQERYFGNLEVTDREQVLPIVWELAEKLEPEHGIKLRHLRKKDLQAELDRFLECYNIAWSTNWGFVPIGREEMEHTAKEMKPSRDEDGMMGCDTAVGENVVSGLPV